MPSFIIPYYLFFHATALLIYTMLANIWYLITNFILDTFDIVQHTSHYVQAQWSSKVIANTTKQTNISAVKANCNGETS